jgi:hypothetical protein
MRKPSTKKLSVRHLLWHLMMGTALGVLCAGLLLFSSLPELAPLVGPAGSFDRFEFLLGGGLFFGIGAMLTGVMFLVSEESMG